MKYSHVPLFFELILQWFLQTCRHSQKLYACKHNVQRYVSVLVWCTLSLAAKTAYSLPFKQQWHVTIFCHFMAKL